MPIKRMTPMMPMITFDMKNYLADFAFRNFATKNLFTFSTGAVSEVRAHKAIAPTKKNHQLAQNSTLNDAIEKAAHSAASRVSAQIFTSLEVRPRFFVIPNTSSSPTSELETL